MGAKKQKADYASGQFERGQFLWEWEAFESEDGWHFELWRSLLVKAEHRGHDYINDEVGWRGRRATKDLVKVAMGAIVVGNG